MSDPILATKLYKPVSRPEQILRTRLHGRLTEGLSRKLTLISAPAGFGKTTLLGEWLDQPPAEEADEDGEPVVARSRVDLTAASLESRVDLERSSVEGVK